MTHSDDAGRLVRAGPRHPRCLAARLFAASQRRSASSIEEAVRRREELDGGRARKMSADEFWSGIEMRAVAVEVISQCQRGAGRSR